METGCHGTAAALGARRWDWAGSRIWRWGRAAGGELAESELVRVHVLIVEYLLAFVYSPVLILMQNIVRDKKN